MLTGIFIDTKEYGNRSVLNRNCQYNQAQTGIGRQIIKRITGDKLDFIFVPFYEPAVGMRIDNIGLTHPIGTPLSVAVLDLKGVSCLHMLQKIEMGVTVTGINLCAGFPGQCCAVYVAGAKGQAAAMAPRQHIQALIVAGKGQYGYGPGV